MTSAILPFNSTVESPGVMTGIPSKCPINSRGSPSAEPNLNPKPILVHLDRSIDSSKEQEGCDKSNGPSEQEERVGYQRHVPKVQCLPHEHVDRKSGLKVQD